MKLIIIKWILVINHDAYFYYSKSFPLFTLEASKVNQLQTTAIKRSFNYKRHELRVFQQFNYPLEMKM